MNSSRSRNQTLEAEGWTKMLIANEPRLSEAVELYKESGFDVHLEPLPKEPECNECPGEDEEAECRVCFEGSEDQYKIIYTRQKKDVDDLDEDLF